MRPHLQPLLRPIRAPRRPAWRLIRSPIQGLFGIILAAALAACGSDGANPINPVPPPIDEEDRRLVIVTPPGDEIGLAPNGSTLLYVRYLTDAGRLLRDEPVEFALEESRTGENTSGATLSTTTAITNEVGEARVELFTGAEDVRFRVSAAAPGATTVYFSISVSRGGFARLTVEPIHEGWRDLEGFDHLLVRMYPTALVTCASIDLDTPPPSAITDRELSGFGGSVEFTTVSAGQPHTVLALARRGGESAVAFGCVELAGTQLPASQVQIALAVRDRSLVLPPSLALGSRFDLGPVAEALRQSGRTRAWEVLACPDGPGQLVLDCVLDLAAPDSRADCVVEADDDELLSAIESARGLLDEAGCRGPERAGGGDSLERILSAALASEGAFPVDGQLATLLAVRNDITQGFELYSKLTISPGGVAEHRLQRVHVATAAGSLDADIGASSRPVVSASGVGLALDDNRLEISEHGFTLRYHDIARTALSELGLSPLGLPPDPDQLGQALLDGFVDDGAIGCTVVSELVCVDIDRDNGCLVAACDEARVALAETFTRWLDGLETPDSGLDFNLSASTALRDDDSDLNPDGLADDSGADDPGDAPPLGQWNAHIELADDVSAGNATIWGSF